MRCEPLENLCFEFGGGGADSAAVVGVRDLPQNGSWISGGDALAVAERDIAVFDAVDEQDGNLGCGDGGFGGDPLEIEVVLPACIGKGNLDGRTENGSTEPWAGVEELAYPIIGDFVEVGERRFRDDRTETGFDGEGLQKLGSAHGFAEAENAGRVLVVHQPVEPQVDVVAFEEAVGGKLAVAGAVGAGVGHKDRVVVIEQVFCVARHACPVVGETVEEDDGNAVGMRWSEKPCSEGDVVGSAEGDVLQRGGVSMRQITGLSYVSGGQRATGRVERDFAKEDAGGEGEEQVGRQREEDGAAKAHGGSTEGR